MNRNKISAIQRYLEHFQQFYPEILVWFSKVTEEEKSGQRTIIPVWNGLEIEGLAITKNGCKAKLCHISIAKNARSHGVGGILLNVALRNMARNGAKEVRVTTSEEVFREHGSFFRAAGFTVVDWQVNRYRAGASEILWKLNLAPDMETNNRSYLDSTLKIGKSFCTGVSAPESSLCSLAPFVNAQPVTTTFGSAPHPTTLLLDKHAPNPAFA